MPSSATTLARLRAHGPKSNRAPLKPLLQQVLLRCPECLKLYSSSAKKLSPPRPHFYCPNCQQSFWHFYTELLQQPCGLIGYKLQAGGAGATLAMGRVEKNAAAGRGHRVTDYKGLHGLNSKAFRCPQCYKPYAGGQNQCHSCGVVFSKMALSSFDFLTASVHPHKSLTKGRGVTSHKATSHKATSHEVTSHAATSHEALNSTALAHCTPAEIKQLWQYVVRRYDDPQGHRALMQLCVEWGHFAYLAERYKCFLQLYPADKTAKQALQQLQLLAHSYFTSLDIWPSVSLVPRLLSLHARSTLLFLAAVLTSWSLLLSLPTLFAFGLISIALIWLV